jgi:hypothetical protein
LHWLAARSVRSDCERRALRALHYVADTMFRSTWAVLLFVAASMGACGAPEPGAQSDAPGEDELTDWTRCSDTRICGGDLVGSWEVRGKCWAALPATGFASQCPEALQDFSGVMLVGTVTYEADNTYTKMLTQSGNLRLTQPFSCLRQEGRALTCEEYEAQFVPSNGWASAECQSEGETCSCNIGLIPEPLIESGTYSAKGGTLSEARSVWDYCVDDETLTLWEQPRAGAAFVSRQTLARP